jgi:hypothetical protein
MRLALTQSGETIEQLATRVYALDKPSASELKAATAALSEANLFLRKPDDVPPGTVVEVPEHGGLEGGEAAAPIVAGLAADQLRGVIALTAQTLSGSLDEEIAGGKASAKLVRSRDVKSVTAEDETFDDAQLTVLAGNAEQRVTDAQALRSYHKDVVKQISSDLDGLLSLLGGGNGT